MVLRDGVVVGRCQWEPYVPGDLALGDKTGYIFTVTGTKEGYAVTAVPKVFNSTGRRTFFSDQTLVIRENWGAEPATAQSKEIK